MATLDAEPIGHILNRGCPGGVVSAGLKEGRAWGASFSFASSQEFFRVNQEQARPTPGFTGVLFQAEAALVLSLCFPLDLVQESAPLSNCAISKGVACTGRGGNMSPESLTCKLNHHSESGMRGINILSSKKKIVLEERGKRD